MGLFRNGKPVILKESSRATEQLAALEALRGTLPAAKEKELEADIRAIRAGIVGENNILYELRNSHMDMMVLQDLFLEYDGLTAQIDFLVCTRQRFFVLECKNLYGNIEINERGDFIRTFGGRRRECIYSPVTQNQRHLKLIRALLRDSRDTFTNLLFDRDFYDYYRSLVVLANPKTVLNDRKAPANIKNAIVRVDQLLARIEAINAERGPAHDKMFMSALQGRSEWFLNRNKDTGGNDFAAKYRDLATANGKPPIPDPTKSAEHAASPSAAEKTAPEQPAGRETTPGDDVMCCPKCGSPMVLRTAKRGKHAGEQFYGCSKFPKCRGVITIDASQR